MSSRSSSKQEDWDESEGEESNPVGDLSEDEYVRRSRRHRRTKERSYRDFMVDIPEFESQLESELFLDWLQTIERVFEFKYIPEEK